MVNWPKKKWHVYLVDPSRLTNYYKSFRTRGAAERCIEEFERMPIWLSRLTLMVVHESQLEDFLEDYKVDNIGRRK